MTNNYEIRIIFTKKNNSQKFIEIYELNCSVDDAAKLLIKTLKLIHKEDKNKIEEIEEVLVRKI